MSEYTLETLKSTSDVQRTGHAWPTATKVNGMQGNAPLLVVAPIPPPVTGQSLATERLLEIFVDRGLRLRIADTAPAREDSWQSQVVRVVRLGWALVKIVTTRFRGSQRIYISVLANLGMYHTALCALLARLLGYRLFLHHHVASYTKSPKPKMTLLAACAGTNAVHITLCEAMSHDLRRNYRFVDQTMAVSNAIFAQKYSIKSNKKARSVKYLGHISSLMVEKGLQRLVNLFRYMKPKESGIKLLIAGSAYTPVEQKIVDDAVQEFDEYIRIVGHISGQEKEEFFEKIDVFIFPSLYRHEAAPLVCLESMSAGVPFIAYDWGYVKSSTDAAGTFVNSDEAFEEQALKTLQLWASEPQQYKNSSIAVREAFDRLMTQSNTQINSLIKLMRSD